MGMFNLQSFHFFSSIPGNQVDESKVKVKISGQVIHEETTTTSRKEGGPRDPKIWGEFVDHGGGPARQVEEGTTETVTWYDNVDLNPTVYQLAVGDGRLIVRLVIHHSSKIGYMFVPGKIYPTYSTTLFSTLFRSKNFSKFDKIIYLKPASTGYSTLLLVHPVYPAFDLWCT